jgi:hypothetical protein
LLFPASTTRAQVQRFFALAEPLPAAVAAETVGRVLERALERGEEQAALGPLSLTATNDADVIAVAVTARSPAAAAGQAEG